MLVAALALIVFAHPVNADNASNTHWVMGGLIGAGAGAAIGTGAGFGLCSNSSRCSSKPAIIGLFGGGMAAFGFAAGSAVGFLFKKDKNVALLTPVLYLDPEKDVYGLGVALNF